MGEAKRRKATDPNYGKAPKIDENFLEKIKQAEETLEEYFFARQGYITQGRGIVVSGFLAQEVAKADFFYLDEVSAIEFFISAKFKHDMKNSTQMLEAYDPKKEYLIIKSTNERFQIGKVTMPDELLQIINN